MQENPSECNHTDHCNWSYGIGPTTYWNVSWVVTVLLLFASCAKGPFVPVSTGREYGSPKTPRFVSHLPEANQWALRRSGHHNVFQRILCFNFPCRKMIGRRKVLKAISFDRLKKQIKKNAKKGAYKKYVPLKKDSLPTKKIVPEDKMIFQDTVVVPLVAAPVLERDSLITLNELLFEIDSYKLQPQQLKELDSIAKFLKSHPALEVNVSGHTDNTGSERHNISLSTRRAETVA